MVAPATLAELDRAQYIALTTTKRDGTAVRTPVWFAVDGDTIVVVTEGRSGKVKRIRNRGHVRIAPCDARGALQGEPVDASARVLDDPEGTNAALLERLGQ